MSPHPPLLSFGHHVRTGSSPFREGEGKFPSASPSPLPVIVCWGPALFSLHSHSFLLHVLTCVKYQTTDNTGTRGSYVSLTAVLDAFPSGLRFQLIHNHCGFYFQFSASFGSQKSPLARKALRCFQFSWFLIFLVHRQNLPGPASQYQPVGELSKHEEVNRCFLC